MIRRLRLSPLKLSAIALMLVAVLVIQDLRYRAPPAIGTPADQMAMVNVIEKWSGITIPASTRIVAHSGEDERDHRYYYWVLFTKEKPSFPGPLANVPGKLQPRVAQIARSIERSMIPYKIRGAEFVNDYGWSHGDFEVIALVVKSQQGWYTWLDAARQDPRASQ